MSLSQYVCTLTTGFLKTELPFNFLLVQHFALSSKEHSEMDLANYAFDTQVKLIKIHFLIRLMLRNRINNYHSERLQCKN